ncbi:MAG: hypothetical protein WED34_11060 [Planctomycetales bacterium]
MNLLQLSTMNLLQLAPGVAVAVASLGLAALAAEDRPVIEARPERPRYELPADPKAPVVVLDYKGGFTPPVKNDEPSLVIRADGTVVLGDKFGMFAPAQGKLAPDELQDLLRFLLVEQKLAQFDDQSVRKAIAAATKPGQPLIAIADAATTELTIHADGKTVTISRYALDFEASQLPTVEPLQQALAAQKRLERLRSEIYAGGNEAVAKYVALANAELKRQQPDFPPLSAEDMQNARRMANGELRLTFQRVEEPVDGRRRFTAAQIVAPAVGKPTVRVDAQVLDAGR